MSEFKINLGKKGLSSMVSGLEADILDCLWQHKHEDSSGRSIYACVKKSHKVAYSSIVVTLDRMHEKDLIDRKVERGKGGLKYLFYPKYSREELGNRIADNFLVFMKKTFGEPSTAYLHKKLSEKK